MQWSSLEHKRSSKLGQDFAACGFHRESVHFSTPWAEWAPAHPAWAEPAWAQGVQPDGASLWKGWHLLLKKIAFLLNVSFLLVWPWLSVVNEILRKSLESLIPFLGLRLGFPCGSACKESSCNTGDLGLIPELGRSPGEGKGYPPQYSGLENSMDFIVHGVAKSRTWLSDFHFGSEARDLESSGQSLFFFLEVSFCSVSWA